MPVSKKPVKKPKVKVQKGTGVTKSHKGTGVSKIKQKQKQSVSVNVTIDQSKKGKSSSSSVSRMQQPANIINFPSNTPVSEIRYNPIIINPEKLQDNNKVVSETSLVKTEEKPKLYVNPNRPIITDNSLLGTVADTALQLASSSLKERYPENSELIDMGSQVTGYLGSKLVSADLEKTREGLTRQVNKGYNYLFGKKKDSSISSDAWDNLSSLSVSTHGNLSSVGNSKPPTIAERKQSSISTNFIPSTIAEPKQSKASTYIAESKPSKASTIAETKKSQVSVKTPYLNYSDYNNDSKFSGINPNVFSRDVEHKQNDLSDAIFSRDVVKTPNTPSKVKTPNAPSKKNDIITPKGKELFESDSQSEIDIIIGGHIPEGVGRMFSTDKKDMASSPTRPLNDYLKYLQTIKGLGYTRQEISKIWASHPDNKKAEQKSEINRRKDMGENDTKKKKKDKK